MASDERVDLGSVPFYWRVSDGCDKQNFGVPARLPFAFSFRADLGLVTQEFSPIVTEWLERVYTMDENVGYLQEGSEASESYGTEFLTFMLDSLVRLGRNPDNALEVGCGGCFLLLALKERGIEVTGVDPSPLASRMGERHRIRIVPHFYSQEIDVEPSDLIFHYDVLEHIADPVHFLRQNKSHLSNTGTLIFAVPDCSRSIDRGDVTMYLHEHLNYFDEESLLRTVKAAGLDVVEIKKSRHGGVLFCVAVAGQNVAGRSDVSVDSGRFARFCQLSGEVLKVGREFFILQSEDRVGVYVPLRAFAFLPPEPAGSLFFYDDNSDLHGKFYDGFPQPIGSIRDLGQERPSKIFIASNNFGHAIEAKISETGIAFNEVMTLSALLDSVLDESH